MKKTGFIMIALLLLGWSVGQAQTIDTDKSKVTFEIGNMGVKTVEGSFSGMTGEVVFDPASLDKAMFRVCIDAASVDTENQKRDDHLRNEDFFHVDKYPKICFISTDITKTADGYLAKGKLTMHGVTRVVELPFTYNNNVFSGKLELNRYDYKVGEDTGTFMVSNEVEIQITCHVNR